MNTRFIDCKESGIEHKAEHNNFKAYWNAGLTIPLSLINKSDQISKKYKFNFFRIDITS